ncbi:hypothetical protein [Actinomadura chokoriensis]|uniref:hypothetical protein n=1 Tax=Actinomadura chokoriensis TaxID=454156 RepID=UPI0031F7AA78
MLAAHDELIAGAGDRVTVLRLGSGLDEEGRRLYLRLAGSTTPLERPEGLHEDSRVFTRQNLGDLIPA